MSEVDFGPTIDLEGRTLAFQSQDIGTYFSQTFLSTTSFLSALSQLHIETEKVSLLSPAPPPGATLSSEKCVDDIYAFVSSVEPTRIYSVTREIQQKIHEPLLRYLLRCNNQIVKSIGLGEGHFVSTGELVPLSCLSTPPLRRSNSDLSSSLSSSSSGVLESDDRPHSFENLPRASFEEPISSKATPPRSPPPPPISRTPPTPTSSSSSPLSPTPFLMSPLSRPSSPHSEDSPMSPPISVTASQLSLPPTPVSPSHTGSPYLFSQQEKKHSVILDDESPISLNFKGMYVNLSPLLHAPNAANPIFAPLTKAIFYVTKSTTIHELSALIGQALGGPYDSIQMLEGEYPYNEKRLLKLKPKGKKEKKVSQNQISVPGRPIPPHKTIWKALLSSLIQRTDYKSSPLAVTLTILSTKNVSGSSLKSSSSMISLTLAVAPIQTESAIAQWILKNETSDQLARNELLALFGEMPQLHETILQDLLIIWSEHFMEMKKFCCQIGELLDSLPPPTSVPLSLSDDIPSKVFVEEDSNRMGFRQTIAAGSSRIRTKTEQKLRIGTQDKKSVKNSRKSSLGSRSSMIITEDDWCEVGSRSGFTSPQKKVPTTPSNLLLLRIDFFKKVPKIFRWISDAIGDLYQVYQNGGYSTDEESIFMEEFMDEFATNLGELSRGFSESFERYVFPPLLLCTDSANQYSAMGSTDPEEFYLVEKEIEMTWYAVSVSYFRSTNGIFEAIGNLSTGFSEYLLKKTEAEKNRERVKEMKEEEGDKEEDSHPYKDNIWYLPSSHQLYKNEPSKFPSLNVLILLVGSRGDIQPFVALAHGLREAGHNIRFGTHEMFKDFIEDYGFEFVSIGGDPRELMAFVVRHPNMVTFNMGEVQQQTEIMDEIINGTWHACTAPSPSAPSTPYQPDVILANPPVMVHVHLAEKLCVPLQIWFTMPWTPTSTYQHPFAAGLLPERSYTNKASFYLVDNLAYTGCAVVIQRFRNKLGLPLIVAGGALATRTKVPHVYCFSEHLVPRPRDWEDHIGICGFLELKQTQHREYTPPQDLADFLDAGDPPIYIGFGSIVVSNPAKLTNTIFQAVSQMKVRALVSRGWGGMGDDEEVPENVFLLGPCPHDWLFPRCSMVCHHGGAGTTATGLRAGLPTTIVYFFADQPFWGSIVGQQLVGPPPIPFAELSAQKLVDSFTFCQQEHVIQNAKRLADELNSEDSLTKAVSLFHKYLPFDSKGRLVQMTYQSERWYPALGWRVRTRRPKWSDSQCLLSRPRERFILPRGWVFCSTSWGIVRDDETNEDGWKIKNNKTIRTQKWFRLSCPQQSYGTLKESIDGEQLGSSAKIPFPGVRLMKADEQRFQRDAKKEEDVSAYEQRIAEEYRFSDQEEEQEEEAAVEEENIK